LGYIEKSQLWQPIGCTVVIWL